VVSSLCDIMLVMITKHLRAIALFVGLALLAAGCGKQETETTAPAAPPSTTTGQAGSDLQDAAKAVQEQGRAVATTASEAATKAATEAKQEATTQAESLLTQAKTYISEKKYQDAVNSLKQVSNLKLTPDQEKVLQDLQKQVQAGLASMGATNAAEKLGSFLGGKK
jgi:outer membrane protein assembly factor BamD (BamD/ComL family)